MAKRTSKPTRKSKARRKIPTKLTRKLTPGFVIAIRFPESIIADTVCYIGEKKVWYDPEKGIIGRAESRTTDYNLSNLTDAHIYQHRFDVERELSYVMSFLRGKRGMEHGTAQIERVRWVPKEVISTNRPLRKVKKYPTECNPKLKIKVLERKYELPVQAPDVNRLLAIAQEAHQRESQIIQP